MKTIFLKRDKRFEVQLVLLRYKHRHCCLRQRVLQQQTCSFFVRRLYLLGAIMWQNLYLKTSN